MNWTLVTGGAKNLGAEICRTLAAQGHSIVVQYRYSESEAQGVAQSCRDVGVVAGNYSRRFFLYRDYRPVHCQLFSALSRNKISGE